MELSRYTLFIDDFPQEGQSLLFHTRTQAQLLVDRRLRELLRGLPAAAADAGAEGKEALAALARMGIVVADAAADRRLLEEWLRELAGSHGHLQATVLTTYDCNFACTYCLEEGVKQALRMDGRTAAAVVRYLEGRIAQERPRELTLLFYGGEPLLNMEALRAVARGVGAACAERGVRFHGGVITNGALLSPRVVEELLSLRITTAKVTLDGTREAHDRKRPFRSGRGSYAAIVENLLHAAGRMTLDVGGNFDEENLASLHDLLEELERLGLKEKIRRVDFKPILPSVADRRHCAPSADAGCVFSEPRVASALLELREAVLRRGFSTLPGLGANRCSMAAGDGSVIIDPAGRTFLCPAFVGIERFCTGDIHDGVAAAVPLELWRRCLDCPYAPLCGDGCLYAAWSRYGDHTRLNCQREFLETMVREGLKLAYRYRGRGEAPP